MSAIEMTRARRLQVLLYNEYGFGYVSKVADAIGLSRGHVSLVLNEQRSSSDTLDKIETWLEAERQTAKEAA